ncbi:phosphatidylinositol mannoside acyltransferase [Myceligenerans pegani]|uniref:Phosphatidylinositol mannoside acyltransferase n=1 Tax=Myceligenerans pegani TaxID=2776917 RepID=A0ABR9MZF5_9MICO|nr:phosphatidylinositol mannoside acyltransferase [Myceligenerans sp. TRM 65318]MBE1876779.1 phosphatidylinositol mannoside acyltransferase [Myceligenerans sp. TRM 65318]MBE3019050.1 phosphatidylinositol mannoside acyltransferase [Myceligenerans sp. TRM 65318]
MKNAAAQPAAPESHLATRAYVLAWKLAPMVPEPLLRALFSVIADLTWLRRTTGVRRLEANYARVRPDLDEAGIRRLSRAGMRSYMRYFREAFTLHALRPHQVDARVRTEGYEENLRPYLDLDGPGTPPDRRGAAALVLGHTGNWDLAGAWGALHIAPVLTVAERLRPTELFNRFVEFRRSIGITALGLGDDGVFAALVAGAKDGNRIVPLLADRDLTARGVEVDLLGHRARVAAGPAALALDADVPLVPAGIHYERLRGARRRAAGSPWGIVITFHEPVIVPEHTLPRAERVRRLTQGWVDALGRSVAEHTADWHMLQRVFTDDLGRRSSRA